MRRQDRALSVQEAVTLLEECEYGVLSLVSPESKPYSVPVNYVYSTSERAIFIHCAPEGKKLDCLAGNPNALFTVVKKAEVIINRFTTLYESAIAEGTACLIDDPDEKKRVLLQLCQKYEPATETDSEILEKTKRYIEKFLEKTTIIKIEVESVFGKANK